ATSLAPEPRRALEAAVNPLLWKIKPTRLGAGQIVAGTSCESAFPFPNPARAEPSGPRNPQGQAIQADPLHVAQGGYAMRTFDLAPLYRSTVGFDRLFSMLDQVP